MATEPEVISFPLSTPPQVLIEGGFTEPAADSSSAPWTVAIVADFLSFIYKDARTKSWRVGFGKR